MSLDGDASVMQMRAYESVGTDTWTTTTGGFSNWNERIHSFLLKKKKKKKKGHALSQWNHSVAEYSALVSLSLFILPFNYYTVELPVLIRSAKWPDIHTRTSWRFDGQTCYMSDDIIHKFVKFSSFKFKKNTYWRLMICIFDKI